MQSSRPNPALQDLDFFVGEWEMDFTLAPGARQRVRFEWALGGAVLVEDMDGNATWIIGRDESVEGYCVLYFDSRGVSRVYNMSLEGRYWKIWRNSPGFSQRFTGTLSDSGDLIAGRWEKSGDGSAWEHDFDVTYRRVK